MIKTDEPNLTSIRKKRIPRSTTQYRRMDFNEVNIKRENIRKFKHDIVPNENLNRIPDAER